MNRWQLSYLMFSRASQGKHQGKVKSHFVFLSKDIAGARFCDTIETEKEIAQGSGDDHNGTLEARRMGTGGRRHRAATDIHYQELESAAEARETGDLPV
jgi:hypothetical protein